MAATDLAAERTTLAHTRTKKALMRTRLAYERTLMAWVRTAVSLITFGFTIYKFFDFLQASLPPERRAGIIGPRGFALVMMSLGVAALGLATFEHRANLKELDAEYGEYGPIPRSLSVIVAAVVALLGVLGVILVLFND
jgi:putative membrane protein